MKDLSARIEALNALGRDIQQWIESPGDASNAWLESAVEAAFIRNGWFTRSEVTFALQYWASALTTSSLESFTSSYEIKDMPMRSVGLVMAGNIPMVGMHDLVCTFLAGHQSLIKWSSNDDVLMPALIRQMTHQQPGCEPFFKTVSGKLSGFDAVIATGSNNSTRYFYEYFRHVPHIIRGNRTSIAILDATESEKEMEALAEDCFRYFGLGCRNVTKLYLPIGFDLNKIFAASCSFSWMMENKKYANNYMYHKSLMMLERREVLENDLILCTPSPDLHAPVSVLKYEWYESAEQLNQKIEAQLHEIQCVMGHGHRPFGTAQKPPLSEFADGTDTLSFLTVL